MTERHACYLTLSNATNSKGLENRASRQFLTRKCFRRYVETVVRQVLHLMQSSMRENTTDQVQQAQRNEGFDTTTKAMHPLYHNQQK